MTEIEKNENSFSRFLFKEDISEYKWFRNASTQRDVRIITPVPILLLVCALLATPSLVSTVLSIHPFYPTLHLPYL